MLLFITHAKSFISGTDTTEEPNIIATGVVKIKQVLNCTITFVIFSISLRRYKMPQAIALRHNKSAKSQSTLLCSGNQGGAPPFFVFLLILYTSKNVRNLCFHDFS